MKNPSLIALPFAHWIADILNRFEDGKPLNSDQLNFLLRHEKTLETHSLDLVFKYYLGAHKTAPTQALPFTLPNFKLDTNSVHQIKNTIQTLLNKNLKHVDLKMSMEQFLQFKAVGIHELVYWHGPQFLSQTTPFPGAAPQVIYLQWGKLFGVVKLNNLVESHILDGNLLIYFEDMDLRSLNQCVLDYTSHHKLELEPQLQFVQKLEEAPLQHHTLPTPTPNFYIIGTGGNEQHSDQT